MNRKLVIYLLLLALFFAFAWGVIYFGQDLQNSDVIRAASKSTDMDTVSTFIHNLKHPVSTLLLQIIIIIATARFFGLVVKKMGQPAVIGEIIAGIALGPSFLGWVFPSVSEFLFAKNSLGSLFALSQIGLIFFMFLIGLELDIKTLKEKTPAAVAVSHASIIFPYALGLGLAYFIYQDFAPKGVSFMSFALFLGISMSITAFPVLARILKEKGLTKTEMGIMALAVAAADDVTAWCILATVIAIVKAGDLSIALWTIGLSTIYVFFMINVAKRLVLAIEQKYLEAKISAKTAVMSVFLFIIISSAITEIIGIHALFGAFMSGVVMSMASKLKQLMFEKVEDIAILLFLPLFFAFTGLRTQIGSLDTIALWMVCFVVMFLAVVGKFGGSFLAAKASGMNIKDSSAIGILMNTRGLMELVVLNIGYDLGILSQELFAIFVIMALATTMMTAPLLSAIKISQ